MLQFGLRPCGLVELFVFVGCQERFTSMQEAFLKLDEDRDGKITIRELLSKCRAWNIADSEAQRVLAEGILFLKAGAGTCRDIG